MCSGLLQSTAQRKISRACGIDLKWLRQISNISFSRMSKFRFIGSFFRRSLSSAKYWFYGVYTQRSSSRLFDDYNSFRNQNTSLIQKSIIQFTQIYHCLIISETPEHMFLKSIHFNKESRKLLSLKLFQFLKVLTVRFLWWVDYSIILTLATKSIFWGIEWP